MTSLDKFCRLCLSDENVTVDLFQEVHDGVRPLLYQKIMHFVPVKIQQGDDLPGLLCFTCVEHINKFWCFKDRSERVDAALRNLLEENENSKANVSEERVKAIAKEVCLFSSGSHEGRDVEKEICILQTSDHLQPTAISSQGNPNVTSDSDDDWFESSSHDTPPSTLPSYTRTETGKGLAKINPKIKQKGRQKKDHVCEFCGRVFTKSSHLVQHELTHVAEKPFKCSDCGKDFWYKASLIGHVKQNHTGDVNYTCEVCGKRFFKKTELTRHKPSHSNETPHKCPECGLGFKITKTLKRHMRTVHSGQRSHTCDTCGKSFAQLQTLKVHLILHSGVKPYVCSHCGKAFAQSAPLRTHIRIHTGEKPYSCHVCNESFSNRTALTSHALKHGDTLPYPCTRCSAAFRLKKDLVKHQQLHDDQESHQGRIQVLKIESINTQRENGPGHFHHPQFEEELGSEKLYQLSASQVVVKSEPAVASEMSDSWTI